MNMSQNKLTVTKVEHGFYTIFLFCKHSFSCSTSLIGSTFVSVVILLANGNISEVNVSVKMLLSSLCTNINLSSSNKQQKGRRPQTYCGFICYCGCQLSCDIFVFIVLCTDQYKMHFVEHL